MCNCKLVLSKDLQISQPKAKAYGLQFAQVDTWLKIEYKLGQSLGPQSSTLINLGV